MHEQIGGREHLWKGVDQSSPESQVLRRVHEDETVEQGSSRQVLIRILRPYGLDDRETFILMARAGMEGDGPLSLGAIGQACRARFGYSVSRQRVFSIVQTVLDRIGDEDKEAIGRVAPLILEGSVSRLTPAEREQREQKLAIGRMRRGAKSLKIPLNYGAVLKHFGVKVPARRNRTAALMGPEASMVALHEDFRMRAACGWRLCSKCSLALRNSQYFVGQNGVVPWCKDCNRKMARDRYQAQKVVK